MIRGVRLFSTVNWYSWDKEAFRKARRFNLPTLIFCGTTNPFADRHINHTLFSDPDVCDTLNDLFVPVKLTHSDRDIRKAMTMYIESKFGNNIGLFHTVVLNPKTLNPYNCSADVTPDTYRKFLMESSTLEEGITPKINGFDDSKIKIDVDDTLDQAYFQYKDVSYNQDSIFRFIMGYALSQLHRKHPAFVSEELNAIAKGGVVDHIGGGVFSGAYFKDWHLPQLSKQLVSQSMLLTACATSLQGQPNSMIQKLAESLVSGIVQLVNCNSSIIQGTSDTYFWEYKQFMAALSPDIPDLISKDLLQMYWGVNENGNINPELLDADLKIPPLMNVLTPYKSIQEVAATFGAGENQVKELVDRSHAALRKYRAQYMAPEERIQEMLPSHRGLALSALSRASTVLPEDSAATAVSLSRKLAADMVEVKKGELLACDDYAYTITGLLDYYYYVSRENIYLVASRSLQDEQIDMFRDINKGGFFYSQQIANLFSRPKFTTDSLDPNYNAISASNMLRLARSSKDKYINVAKRAISQGAKGTTTHPLSHLSTVEAQIQFTEAKKRKYT